MEWINTISNLASTEKVFAVATVNVGGSAPREIGAKIYRPPHR